MRSLFFIVSLFLSYLSFGQDPYYLTIDKNSGLPSNSVYDIFQDNKGFMWFATGKGLCRYDGNNIKTYTSDLMTSKAGSCIQEDAYGRIWYENFDGYLYYIENEKVVALPQAKTVGYYRYGFIKNRLFLLQQDGVLIYDLKNLKIIKKLYLKLNTLKFSFCTKDNFYILNDIFYELNYSGEITTVPVPKEFESNFISPIIQNSAHGLLICSKYSHSLFIYENRTFTKKTSPNKSEFIQNIAFTNSENWICSTNGVTKIDTDKNSSATFFNDKNIATVFCDKQKNYWIATLNEGVFYVNNFDHKLHPLTPRPFVFSTNKDALLVGSDKEVVNSFDVKNHSFKNVFQGSSDHAINQLICNKSTNTLYFTASKFKTITHSKLILEIPVAIKEINKIDDKYYTYAASSNSGIFIANKNAKSSWDALFKNHQSKDETNFNQAILIPYFNGKSTVYNPINQTIYYATNNGLFAVSKKDLKELKYKNKTLFINKLCYYNNIIYATDTNEKVYVITNNRISEFNLPKKNKNTTIEKIDLEQHFLYLYTSSAIFEINLKTNQCQKVMTLTQGVDITDIAIVNDHLYFASAKGIISKKRTNEGARNKSKIFIEEILVNDETHSIKKPLEYYENNIKIKFTTLSFIPNEKNEVYYKINSSKWYKLDPNAQSLLLSSLSPNDYHIYLKVNNDATQEIKFTIKKPLWLNLYILIPLGLLVLTLIYLLFKWQIEKIKRKNQLLFDKVTLEKNLNQSKLKAIKSQMNPHFFYNALNTLQSYILANEKRNAIDYLSKFSKLTRTILELTEKESISISEEVTTLGLYLDIEKARFDDDFNYTISTNNIDTDTIKIPSMLLQPYIENAVKHGLLHKQGEKILLVDFSIEDEILKITIDDNGIGREKSAELNAIKNKKHQSFATNALQNRIELLNQFNHKNIAIRFIDKHSKTEQSTGTTVEILIPLTA